MDQPKPAADENPTTGGGTAQPQRAEEPAEAGPEIPDRGGAAATDQAAEGSSGTAPGGSDGGSQQGGHTPQETAGGEQRQRGWRRFAMDTRPLRHPAFRRLWASTTVTAVGSQLTAVAVPKQVYDITGSSAWVGYASFAGLLPLVVFALWGGAVADTVDRRKLLLVTNAGIAVTSLLFWVQALAGVRSVVLLMVLLALQQAFFGMNSPARQASIPRLVSAAELPAANALGSTVAQTGMVVGPLLAGALIPLLGLPELYLIDALALCAAVWAVWRLPALPPQQAPADGSPTRRRAGWREVAAGFRYMAASQVLLLSFLADVIAMVLGMPRALFPQLAATTYAPWGQGFALGLLFAAIPIGAVSGGLLSGTFSRARAHGNMMIGSVVVWGLAIAGAGLSQNLWWAAAFLAAGGVADMVSMVFRGAILQSAATDEMRGRMQGVFTVVVAGGPRLADLLHGTGGAVLGARAATVTGGVLVATVMLVLAVALPALRRYRV